MTKHTLTCGTLAVMVLVSACGGGGGAAVVEPVVSPFAEGGTAGSAEPVAIHAAVLDSAGRATSTAAGTFDESVNLFTIGSLSGTTDDAGEVVTLEGGGQIKVIPGTTEFAAAFVAEPQGANRLIGVVGVETAASDLPSSTATYTGNSALTIVDGSDLFDLTGDAAITADFGSGTVTSTVDNLSGTVSSGGATAPESVSDVGTITFSGLAIAGSTFAGGAAELTSDLLTPLSGSEGSSLNGAFFGPGANEAGATFVIDDGASGGVTIFGTAVAD